MPSSSSSSETKWLVVVAILAAIAWSACGGGREEPRAEAPQAEVPQSGGPPQEVPLQSAETANAEIEILSSSEGSPSITIDEIIANGRIAGLVAGVAPSAVGDFKVLVYVHTDQWYIHPFAGQGEGQSWAPVRGDLTWSIRSVKRQYAADQVAALLVSRDVGAVSTVWDISEIPSKAWVIVRGTGEV